ncbi:MAG: hypothetical protein ACP5NS_04240 [Candidatus Pacearchaeota archaeon]
MVHHKHILIIDTILIVGTLFLIAGFVGYARPLVIAPLDDYVTTENSVLFVFEKADVVLIDDNLAFTSPQEVYVRDEIIITLPPGVYYWKVVGALESDVRQLTIESAIDLKIRESENGTVSVVNSGSVPLEVSVYNQGVLSDRIVVDTDSQASTAQGEEYFGRQNED